MKFPKIEARVMDLYGFEAYDSELEKHVWEYLNACFPGPTWIVYGNNDGRLVIEAEFNDDAVASMFILKYGE